MDKIFRFYDLKQFEELYGFVRFTGEEDGIVKLADPFMMSLARSSEDINSALYLNEDEMVDCSFDKKEESFRFTKKDIKRESALCKQKIKIVDEQKNLYVVFTNSALSSFLLTFSQNAYKM